MNPHPDIVMILLFAAVCWANGFFFGQIVTQHLRGR